MRASIRDISASSSGLGTDPRMATTRDSWRERYIPSDVARCRHRLSTPLNLNASFLIVGSVDKLLMSVPRYTCTILFDDRRLSHVAGTLVPVI
jgi:hypothetical protein